MNAVLFLVLWFAVVAVIFCAFRITDDPQNIRISLDRRPERDRERVETLRKIATTERKLRASVQRGNFS